MKRNAKGFRIGEDHHRAVLTDRRVLEVITHFGKGKYKRRGYGWWAKRYHCGESTIRDIVKRRTRTDVVEPGHFPAWLSGGPHGTGNAAKRVGARRLVVLDDHPAAGGVGG